MNDFHFLRPNFLFLFIPFFIVLFLLIRSNRSSPIWNHVCEKELLPYVLGKKAKGSYFPCILIFSLGLLLITALAGPAWQLIAQPLIKSQAGLVIVLDLSASMNADDIKPSRLQRAIYKINDLLTSRQEGQTALVVFSGEAFVVTPLTDDVATIKALLPVLETKIMPSSGQQTNKGILKATELLNQAGISNGSILLVASELSKQEMEKVIDTAAQKKIAVSVLGVGTEEGSPIPNLDGGFIQNDKGALVISMLAKENFNRLASLTKGSFKAISFDDGDIKELAKRFSPMDDYHSQEQIELRQNKWHDQGYLLVVLALPFALLFFRRGLLLSVLFLMPQAIQASLWDDLWKTHDQQAEQLFHQEKYNQAKELFQSTDWQAAANYKAGDYEAAADLFQNNQTAEGFYNYGTAKAKQGDLEAALQAYNKTLDIQPDHEDALYNKKIIEELKEKEEQKNKDQKEQQNQQNQQDQSQDQKNQKDQQDQSQNPEKTQENDQQKSSDQEQNQDKKENAGQDQTQENSPDSEQNQSDNQIDEKKTEERQEQYREQVEKEMKENEGKQSKEPFTKKEEQLENDPQSQIDERWLQKIKDDPGGLLRRKFFQQYRQQNR